MILKYSFLIMLLYGCFSFSAAQSYNDLEQDYPKRFISEIELFVGPSLSFLRGNPSVDNNSVVSRSLKLGYSYGLALTHSFNEKIHVKGFLFFESKGGIAEHKTLYFDESSQTFKNGQSKYEYIYDYYTLSCLLGYTPGKNNRFKISLGCFTSYLNKQIVQISHTPQGTKGMSDQTTFNTTFDFGFCGSISYTFPISHKILLSGTVLNNLGLINTRSNSDYGTQKTNNTNLLIGITINKHGKK